MGRWLSEDVLRQVVLSANTPILRVVNALVLRNGEVANLMMKLLTNVGVILVPVVLVIGLAIGLMMRPTIDQLLQPGEVAAVDPHGLAHADHDPHDHAEDNPSARLPDHPLYEANQDAEEHEEDHLPLSRQAFQNLKLSMAAVKLSDYQHQLRMPGEITEAPVYSSLKVAAPVGGRVTRIFAAPGSAIEPGDQLAEVEIIDDELMQAQLRLLQLLTKQEIVDAEIARLAPLAKSGGVAGRKLLEWGYQQKEVHASLSTVRQELTMRGLTGQQVDGVVDTRQAVTRMVVSTPSFSPAPDTPRPMTGTITLSAFLDSKTASTSLQVEALEVEVGQSVERGEPICGLASHGLLMVRGHAFENEIDHVSRLAGTEASLAVEFGCTSDAEVRSGFKVQYVAGHADEHTQTFYFYIPLANELLNESRDITGQLFRTWRHKVGQRVYVLVPTKEIPNQIVLPREAVMQEGPDAIVFREHVHEEPDGHLHEEDEEDVFIELEPVPVTIVTRDKAWVVIAPGEELAVGDHIATGSAYQLHLALESQKEGGGGGHHHHH